MGRKMAKLNDFWYAVIIVIALGFVACSKTATPNGPGAGTGPGGRPGGQTSPNDKTGSNDLGTGGGSLSEAGKGQSTETPRSSPLQEVYFGFDSFDLSTDARARRKARAGAKILPRQPRHTRRSAVDHQLRRRAAGLPRADGGLLAEEP